MNIRPHRHIIKLLKWLLGIVVVLLIIFGWSYYHDSAPSGAPMGEAISPDEVYYTARIVGAAIQLSMNSRAALLEEEAQAGANPALQRNLATSPATAPGYGPRTYRRDVHAKSHGCVAAKFEVKPAEERLSHGLFARPATYDAIIRFSSGQPALNPDNAKDARGFAIKVLNVPGTKLLDFETDGATQDFVLMNNPTFFIRTIEQYAAFSEALGADRLRGYFLPVWWKPATWHVRQAWQALGTRKARPVSLATERFWSASAYALGPQNFVKYSARPCPANRALQPVSPPNSTPAQREADYLRLEMAAQSAKGGACWDFMVQPQVMGKNMPVEDTTVEWKESDSPFIPVAKVTIVAGANNTAEMNERCESLAFNPWHALPEHRPAGVMNRVRKALYQGMAGFRRGKNCQAFCQTRCEAEKCAAGCEQACLANCPLAQDPAAVSPALPAGTCQAQPAAQPATAR